MGLDIKKIELEPIKQQAPEIEGLAELQEINSNITKQISDEILKQFNQAIVEGLKRKGFNFHGDRKKLIRFIENRCHVEENEIQKRRIYYVNNIAFLVWDYNQEISQDIDPETGEITITGTWGEFSFNPPQKPFKL